MSLMVSGDRSPERWQRAGPGGQRASGEVAGANPPGAQPSARAAGQRRAAAAAFGAWPRRRRPAATLLDGEHREEHVVLQHVSGHPAEACGVHRAAVHQHRPNKHPGRAADPASTDNSVVLPAPLGPTIATTSPGAASHVRGGGSACWATAQLRRAHRRVSLYYYKTGL